MSIQPKYNTLLIGCGNMGAQHARHIAECPVLNFVGVCDAFEPNLTKMAQTYNIPGYTHFTEALKELNPVVVVICTSNTTHAPLTVEAANFPSVKAIYCEKPMATNMADARLMVDTCRTRNVALGINHQRRISQDLIEMKRLIDSGAIGEVKLVRLHNAGDILSDGTHAIDSLMYLAGDCDAEWVLGQVHNEPKESPTSKKDAAAPQFRLGHTVETGGFAIIKLTNGWRAELYNGDLVPVRSPYQEYIIEGEKGRLWRTGDITKPNLFIQDAQGGDWLPGIDQWMYKPVPAGTVKVLNYGWRPIPVHLDANAILTGYQSIANEIETGTPNKLQAATALKGFEVIMAIYESARLNQKVRFPLQQDSYPLDMMFKAGQFNNFQ